MRASGILSVSLLFLAACAGSAASAAEPGPVRNVVLLVGDGMGTATVTAARILHGERLGVDPPAAAELRLDRAPRGALVRTYSASGPVTDSAAGITAMVTGAKVANGVLSVRPGPDGADTLATLLEVAEARGRATGVVTTTRLTHATPAGLYAHAESRSSTDYIATCLLPGVNPALGDGVEIALGGGRRAFLPEGGHGGSVGRRGDGRDLLREMRRAGITVVETADQLWEAIEAPGGPVVGLFSDSHMAYEADRPLRAPTEPSLADMTRAALRVLSRDPDGLFLLVEGGRIDHALHEGNAYRVLEDMLAFDEALGVVLDELDPAETLVLVTADHDHTMVVAGYPDHGQGILGLAGRDLDDEPYPVLQFANGPGAAERDEPLTAERAADPDYLQPAGVHLRSDTHGGMDVPLYAFGPDAHLARIRGSLDNTAIHRILLDALGGP